MDSGVVKRFEELIGELIANDDEALNGVRVHTEIGVVPDIHSVEDGVEDAAVGQVGDDRWVCVGERKRVRLAPPPSPKKRSDSSAPG